jgi:hypothetical protein
MQVTRMEELEDGGAIVEFDMSQEELIALAKIGILHGLNEMIVRDPHDFVNIKGMRNEGFYRSVSGLDRPVSDS